jgi:serine/threonine-protein kinase
MEASRGSVAEREDRLGEILAALLEAQESATPLERTLWLARYPEFAAELNEFFASADRLHSVAAPLRAAVGADTPLHRTTVPDGDDSTPERVGQSIGDYQVLEEIGRGGMGVVFKARQKSLGRLVALKVLRADPDSTADVRRFRNEAEIVAQLDHPHIVPLYEVGEHAGGVYFSMKLVEGGSLAGQLPRIAADPRAAAQLVATIARAVHHAHQRGVLHRDLKPSNILLDAEGQPFVTDFGLARRLEVDRSLTQSGAVVGTPGYMSPEQTLGNRAAVTTATDVYGLGAVLCALLTGRPPFSGETVLDTLEQGKERDPQPPSRINPAVDRDLETICLKCLQKEPDRRYPSAVAMAEDLERWLNGEAIAARRSTALERLGRWARRQRTVVRAAMAVVLVVVVLAGGNGLWWLQKRARAEGEARALLEEAIRLGHEEKWPEALNAVGHAKGALAGVWADAALRRRVEEHAADLRLLDALQEAQLSEFEGVDVKANRLDRAAAGPQYEAAFRAAGVDVLAGDEADLLAALRGRAIRDKLLAALHRWSVIAEGPRRPVSAAWPKHWTMNRPVRLARFCGRLDLGTATRCGDWLRGMRSGS